MNWIPDLRLDMVTKKHLESILITLILISLFNIISYDFNIGISSLATPLEANQYSNSSDQDYLILKKPLTGDIIFIERNSAIKLGGFPRNLKDFTFYSYNQSDRNISLGHKNLLSGDQIISYPINEIKFISLRLAEIQKDSKLGGLIGGIIGGYLGLFPSAIAGCLGASAISGGDLYFDDNPAAQVVYLAITLGGTALSARLGYKAGEKIAHKYTKIPLTGSNAWVIVDNQDKKTYKLDSEF